MVLVVLGGSWLFLLVYVNYCCSWQSLEVIGGVWWVLVAFGDSLCFLVVLGSSWWFLIVIGGDG